MYCRYCGAQLADDSAYCILCGKKTVKLHPRTVMPPVPDESAAATSSARSFTDKVQETIRKIPDKLTGLMKQASAAVKSFHPELPDYFIHFSPEMWTACGVLMGLIIVMLVETVGAMGAEKLLFPIFREIPQVWIPAILICLIIALVTVIKGYNYRQTEEYKSAVAGRPDADENAVLAVDPGVIDGLDGISEQGKEEVLHRELEKEPISEEAADIIAELEKLSLSL